MSMNSLNFLKWFCSPATVKGRKEEREQSLHFRSIPRQPVSLPFSFAPFLSATGWVRLLSCTLLVFAPSARAAETAGITEPFLDVTLSSSVPGIISKRYFQEGDFVKEGEVILELDRRLEELEESRRKVVATIRKSDFDGTQMLFKTSKGVSKDEVDKKEAEYRVAAVEQDLAAEQLRRRHLAAPLSGTITEYLLEVGEACEPYKPIVRVVDTRRCYFVSNFDAKLGAGLKLDQTVDLQIDTGAAPVAVRGKIVYISPVVDPASGLLKVKVLFDNSDGKIRPGLAGKMTFGN